MMDVLCTIINYQTPDLLETASRSFKTHYPDCPLLILDNGSADGSVGLIQDLASQLPVTELVCLEKNIFHGPAMDHVMRNLASSEAVFFLDSDTETKTSGFLEPMIEYLADDETHYGAGEVVTVNKRGFKSDKPNATPVLLTPYMLLKRSTYLDLPPFVHHGQPTLHNFKKAGKEGYDLGHFPVSESIDHLWRGTSDRFGYGLGWRSKWDYAMNKLGL